MSVPLCEAIGDGSVGLRASVMILLCSIRTGTGDERLLGVLLILNAILISSASSSSETGSVVMELSSL